MTDDSKRLYFITVFALVFYVVGAGFVQSFVNYPTWKLIGADEFKTYHNGMSPLIIKFMVLPWLLEIVLTISLLWLRPQIIPRRAVVVAALMLNAVTAISTLMVQSPIQIQLGDSGLSVELLDRLLETDSIRAAASVLKAFLYLWMMSLVVRNSDIMNAQDEYVSKLRGGTLR
ncbi:MAG: hypothetical protein M3430_19075 [Acidobacteriota bacterium]|nr:hypothetical protein [Acidobacteriota bacterium]